jgi:Tfp pilus assembly protein PilN
MTLPPFDGPRVRQATATLNGEPAAGSPDPPAPPAGSPGSPGAPPSTGFPAAPAAPPPRAQPAAAQLEGAESLNLARRPFVNTRPVERVAAILWVLGVAMLVWNLKLFMGYLGSSQSTRGKLAALERDIAGEQRTNAELQGQVAKLGLDQENREVTFLNRKIDERTFSWSLLFDRMAEVLPDQVRLLRLKPSNVVQREIGLGARPSARELNPPPVVLTLHCEAKDDEALLRFVDNLFAHPAFSEPNLENEEREDSGLLRFDLTVQYQPNAPTDLTTRAPRTRTNRPTRTTRPAGTTPTSRTTRPEQTVETLRALPPAGGGTGGTGDAPAAPPGAAATPPPAAAPGAGSPAGAGLVRVAPPPRWPGAGGPRGPAAPGVPGRPRTSAPAPAPAPGTSEPPPPAQQRPPAASQGPGNLLPPGAPGAGDRR